MTKKTRTVLFLIFLTLFLLITPLAIFYSQGYRIDIDSKRITQTGGLFLKVIPKQAEIYLNEKLTKKTDFFFGSALIENLLPRKYKIEIKKEGYHPWEKNLEIKEKEVVETKNIVLFSENINFEILSKNIENLWFSPDEKKMILKETENGNWVLKLYDLERNIKSRLIGEEDIYTNYIPPLHPPALAGPSGADLTGLEFSEDSKEIYLDIGMEEQEKKFSLKLDKVPPVLTEREMVITTENIITSQAFNGGLYYLDNFGNFFNDEEKLSEKPFPVKTETEYRLSVFPEKVFLREGKTLYLFNPDSKIFEKFFEGINDLKISPDLKKLVYFSDSEIWIFFVKEIANQPKRKAGEQLFLIRLSEKIGNCLWVNSDYLIFNAGNKIKIVEIDDRDRINIVDIAEHEGPEIFFSQNSKKIYILSNGNLYASEALF